MLKVSSICLLVATLVALSCNNAEKKSTDMEKQKDSANITGEAVNYSLDTVKMSGYIAYDANLEGKRPIVLIVHEWWGLNDYPRMRARQLAQLGYFAMAVDMFGNGKTVDNPTDAQAMITPYYRNPEMAYQRLMAAAQEAKSHPQADSSKVAAIGYCFGGGMVLNVARMGADLKGVVSFHGSLLGTPPKKDLLKANILVCHGDADPFVPGTEVQAFRKSMDSIQAQYTFNAYPGATHAFTNPAATETGKKFGLPIAYNAAADSASWNDMKSFFGRIFQ